MNLNTATIIKHNQERKRFQFVPTGKTRTKQSFRDECDINNIMTKYQKTGAIAHVNEHQANYGFATGQDFASAMRTCVQAQEMFNALPSSIRTRFANDPAQFLDFVQDADNKKEGQELGLWPPDPPDDTTVRETSKEQQPTKREAEKKTDTDPKQE